MNYTTKTGGNHYTVITERNAYRVHAQNETLVREAFDHAGLEILAIERDKEES